MSARKKQNVVDNEGFDVPQSESAGATVGSPIAPAPVPLEDESDEEEAPKPVVAKRPPRKVYPGGLRESLALLSHLDATLPERTAREELLKRGELTPLKAHIAALQQGSPVVDIDADGYSKAHGGKNLLRLRLEHKARTDLDVKALLEERDELAEQLRKITHGE